MTESKTRQELLLALENVANSIKAIRAKLQKDPQVRDYCWNFEDAEKQILGTLSNIAREGL